MKILVAEYSRSGFTKRLGEQIAVECGADHEFIEDGIARKTVIGYIRSALEAFLHLSPAISPPLFSPMDYDLVVIGTPIWFWNMASPVRAYLGHHKGQFRRVAFFCTYSGSGHEKVLKDLQNLVGESMVATFAVTDDRLRRKRHLGDMGAFVAKIKNANGVRRGNPTDAQRKGPAQAVPSH